MAIPAFLATTHRYLSNALVTDCATCITDLGTELTALSWTNPGAGKYTSPVDAYGRFFSILFEKNTAANFHVTTYDQFGDTVAAIRIVLDAGGNEVRYYTGSHHCRVQFVNSGTKMEYAGFMSITSPELPEGVHPSYVYCRGNLTTAGAAYSGTSITNWTNWFNGATNNMGTGLTTWGDEGAGSVGAISVAGTRIYTGTYMYPDAVTRFWNGQIPQCLWGPAGTAGAAYTVPIDVGVNALFHASYGTTSRAATLFWRAD